MFIVPGKLRRASEEPQEEARVQGQSKNCERCPMYLTGRTLLIIASACDRVLFDTYGTPVLETEYYSVTSYGIERVA